MTDKRVMIFDTTLRDGEQSPGVNLNAREKSEIAKRLAKLGVDIIEAGFPAASNGDFEAVRTIAGEVKGVQVAALARLAARDIDRAWEAIRIAEDPRLHVFIATSDIHLEKKLKMSRKEALEAARWAVSYASRLTSNVEFSAEDATRSDPDFLCDVVEAAIGAGARIVNIPDTVGYASPEEFCERILLIRKKVSNIEKAVISVHCHDDLGLAVANSLSAVKAGARQVECTVNGIGERAGNAALEEFVMNLNVRKDLYGLWTGINAKEISGISKMVSSLTGMEVQPNKAIVGKNAFAHESGIHQDGVLKHRQTYEIMSPMAIGATLEGSIVLGKHSGRRGFENRISDLGYNLSVEERDNAFLKFKDLTDKQKEVADEDIRAIVENDIWGNGYAWRLHNFSVSSGSDQSPTATLELLDERGQLVREISSGSGINDAAFRAIVKLTGVEARLASCQSESVTGGTDANCKVNVKVVIEGKEFTGRGRSIDTVEASIKAFINAINRHLRYLKQS